MDYIDQKYEGQALQLYDADPDLKARQLMLMKIMDDLADVLFVVIMSRGGSEDAVKKMERVL